MEPLSEGAMPPNLWSPECLARGLPQGGKPTTKSVLRRTVRRARGRKDKRISESELHGAVNCTLPPTDAAERTGHTLGSVYQRRLLLKRADDRRRIGS